MDRLRVVEYGRSRAGRLGALLLLIALLLALPAPLLAQSTGPITLIDTISVLAERTTIPTVAVNPTTNRLYHAGGGMAAVYVVDGATDQLVRSIPMPAPPAAIGINPHTNRVYVAMHQAIVVLDGASDTIITTITVFPTPTFPSLPEGLWAPASALVDVATNRVYFGNGGGGVLPGSLYVLDGATNTLLATVVFPASHVPIAFNPTTRRIYAQTLGSFSVISADTNDALDLPPLPINARYGAALVISSRSNRLYGPAALPDPPNRLVAVNGTTHARIDSATGTLGDAREQPWAMFAVNPTNDHVFLVNGLHGSGQLFVVDGLRGVVIGQLPLPSAVFQLGSGAVNEVTGRVYLAAAGTDRWQILVLADTPGTPPTPVVPEWSPVWLFASGLLALGWHFRGRRGWRRDA